MNPYIRRTVYIYKYVWDVSWNRKSILLPSSHSWRLNLTAAADIIHLATISFRLALTFNVNHIRIDDDDERAINFAWDKSVLKSFSVFLKLRNSLRKIRLSQSTCRVRENYKYIVCYRNIEMCILSNFDIYFSITFFSRLWRLNALFRILQFNLTFKR